MEISQGRNFKRYLFDAGASFSHVVRVLYVDALNSDGEELRTSFNGIEIIMRNKCPVSETEYLDTPAEKTKDETTGEK